MKRALLKPITLAAFGLLALTSAWAQEHQKPATATRSNQVLDGAATLWVDPGLWTRVLSPRKDTIIFIHRDADAHGRVIFESEGKSAETQLEEIIERVRGVPPSRWIRA